MESRPYLSVNVYPYGGGWRVAVLLKQPGRPWPRLLRIMACENLDSQVQDMDSALQAASQVLLYARGARMGQDGAVRHPGGPGGPTG